MAALILAQLLSALGFSMLTVQALAKRATRASFSVHAHIRFRDENELEWPAVRAQLEKAGIQINGIPSPEAEVVLAGLKGTLTCSVQGPIGQPTAYEMDLEGGPYLLRVFSDSMQSIEENLRAAQDALMESDFSPKPAEIFVTGFEVNEAAQPSQNVEMTANGLRYSRLLGERSLKRLERFLLATHKFS